MLLWLHVLMLCINKTSGVKFFFQSMEFPSRSTFEFFFLFEISCSLLFLGSHFDVVKLEEFSKE